MATLALSGSWRRKNALPGFRLSLGFTLFYLSIVVLIPLAALIIRPWELGFDGFIHAVTQPRVLAALKLSFGAAAIAAIVNTVFGLLVAWALTRYRFPGHRLIDALVDLPFALPTSVAGIALCTLYAPNGWIGELLTPLGIKVAYTPLGVVVALIFIGLPFVVRTLQPVLADLGREPEEAAATLGAARSNVPARDPTCVDARAHHRRRARLCARGGRIRLGDLHRGKPADEIGNRAVAYHHQA